MERLLEVSRNPIGAAEISQGCSTRLNCLGQNFANAADQAIIAPPGNAPCGSLWMDTCSIECLGRIDIPDTNYHMAVHYQIFYANTALGGYMVQVLTAEFVAKRLWPEPA